MLVPVLLFALGLVLLIKGGVPGSRGTLLFIRDAVKK